MSDSQKYKQIFEYLSAPTEPSEAHGNFVFGRADPRLVKKMGELYVADLAEYFLITGGIGKDSGELTRTGTPEAAYLGGLAIKHGIPHESIHLEIKATNGGENVRNGLALIEQSNLSTEGMTIIAHATSLRRLSETFRHENDNSKLITPPLYRVPTDYDFDPTRIIDREEAVAELLRLADWPAKDWLPPQPDLPHDLVDFARHRQQ